MNKYNSKKDISWKITSMITEYRHYSKNPTNANGHNKARKSQLVIVVHFLMQICAQIIIMIKYRG